jgi:hypothetical protein
MIAADLLQNEVLRLTKVYLNDDAITERTIGYIDCRFTIAD